MVLPVLPVSAVVALVIASLPEVPTVAESGVAGFVFPGDRVDIVLTQNAPVNGVELKASETIVRNVRVLAADQRTSQTDDKGQVIA